MSRSGFITQAQFQSHLDKHWQTAHHIWPNIRGIAVKPGARGSVGVHTHLKADITDTPWAWADVLKTGSNLTDLATRLHSSLQSIGVNDHHPQSHTLASHSTKPHSALTDVTESQHHNKLHSMTGVQHTAAGLTIGYVLRATGAATFAWGFLTKLGTIDTGVWQGTPIANAYVAGIDQNLLTTSSPTHVTAKLTALTNGYVPYHVSDAAGLANSPIINFGGNIGINVADPDEKLEVNGNIKADTFLLAAGVTPNLAWLSDVTLGTLEEGETIAYDQATAKWIDAWGVEYDNPRLVWKMYTDFFSAGVTSNDPWVGATVINGTLSARPGVENHPGIIRFSSSNTTNSGYRFITSLDCILMAGAESSEFVFKTGTDLSDVEVRLGFQDSLNDTLPTDGVYLHLIGTKFRGRAVSNGSMTATSAYYLVSTSTWYRGKIAVNSDATLVTFILYSAAGVVLWTDTVAANIPTAAGRTVGHGVVAWIGAPDVARIILIELDMMIASQAGYITR